MKHKTVKSGDDELISVDGDVEVGVNRGLKIKGRRFAARMMQLGEGRTPDQTC